jgi:hypothetical protein
MRSMRKLTLAVAIAATAVAAVGAANASAFATPVGVVAQGEFTGVANGGGNQFVYTCTAHGIGPVVSVSITKCAMTTNHPLALPGLTVATGGTDNIPFASTPLLCWEASAVFTDTTIHRATSACTGKAIGLAGVGVSKDVR